MRGSFTSSTRCLCGVPSLLLATWHPFDTTIDVSGIAAKVRAFVSDPWQRGALGDEGVDAVRYALFAAACRHAVCERRRVTWARSARGSGGAVAAVGLERLAVLRELAYAGMKDVAVGVAGSAIGALLAAGRCGRRGRPCSGPRCSCRRGSVRR